MAAPRRKRKNPHAVALSRKATVGRRKIPPERRSEIARNAVQARWARYRAKQVNQEAIPIAS